MKKTLQEEKNRIYQIMGISEAIEISEGNAFVAAAKKAKSEGKDFFELKGKKYKVTVTASKKENTEATNMAIGFGNKSEK